MMKKSSPLLKLILLLLCVQNVLSITGSPQGHHFLIQTKVVIDGKTYNPTNISVTIGEKINIPQYQFNLSSINYNKNVTVPLRLFVWYNAQWTLSRQTLLLKITDKRTVLSLQSHLLTNLLKYNSRKYQAKLNDEKQSVILNSTSVIISYDPQSSLFVSRLEDPAIFNQQHNYIPLASFNNQMKTKPMKITINFNVIVRSDLFINAKNHIVSLNQLSAKIKERIPLIARLPQPELIQPKQIWRLFLSNYESTKKSNKQYNEKIALMANKKYLSLLSPKLHQIPSIGNSLLQPLSSLNLTLSDTFVPTHYFALHQLFILDAINQLQNFLRQNVSGQVDRDYLQLFQQWASKDVLITFVVSILWIILDIFSYRTNNSAKGLSYSFGYFLVAWLIIELFPLSIRIGQSSNAYWGLINAYWGLSNAYYTYWGLSNGLGFLFVSLIFIKFMTSFLQNKFNKIQHKYSWFDKKITEYVFNLIFLAVIANGIMHLYVDKDIQGGTVVLWSFGEFQMLLREYYYFLVMIPPLLLSIKLRSGQPIGWVRLLLLLVIGLKDDYWLFIDHSHWALIVLRLKEEILFLFLFLVKIILGNKPIQVFQSIELQPVEQKMVQEKKSQPKVQQKKQSQEESRWNAEK